MNRTLLRVGALAGAATLASVTAAPGYAATAAKASASAFTINVAGEGDVGSGRYTATNDGSGEETSGQSDPQGSIPTNGALEFGVAAQEAVARDNLTSAACAGIAGDGGSVVQFDESFCLKPGEDIDLSLGKLGLPDLGGGEDRNQLQRAVEDALGTLEGGPEELRGSGDGSGQKSDGDSGATPEAPTPEGQAPDGQTPDGQAPDGNQSPGDPEPKQELQDGLSSEAPSSTQPSSSGSGSGGFQNASYQPAAAAATPTDPAEVEAIVTGIVGALESGNLDALALKGNLGAIQAKCQAGPGLSGDATLIDSRLYFQVGDEQYDLVSLPVNPAPNTKITGDLDEVLNQIIDGLAQNFGPEFQDLSDEAKKQVIDQVVAQIANELGPLDDIVEGTLNKQSRSGGTINVTALDLNVLPAAQAELGAPLASLKLADVACSTGEPGATAGGAAPNQPQVPTVITSGEPQGDEGLPTGVVAGLLALLGAAGFVGYRRVVGA